MKRKRSASHRSTMSMSPIHPSMHFVLFLVLALVLVVFVGYIMQQTAISTRARVMCPQSQIDPKDLISQLSRTCAYGVEYVTDSNGCAVWVCRKAPPVVSPLPGTHVPASPGNTFYRRPSVK